MVLWIWTSQHVLCIVQMAKSSAGRLHSMVGERAAGGAARGNYAATETWSYQKKVLCDHGRLSTDGRAHMLPAFGSQNLSPSHRVRGPAKMQILGGGRTVAG